jgi:hypothetical protein
VEKVASTFTVEKVASTYFKLLLKKLLKIAQLAKIRPIWFTVVKLFI